MHSFKVRITLAEKGLEVVTLAEVAMAPFIERIENLALERLWLDRPRVADWAQRVPARPSVAASRALERHCLPRPVSPGRD